MSTLDRLAPALAASVVLLSIAVTQPAHAAPINMTADEFRLYKDYQRALTDPLVMKMPEGRRLPNIARNFKTKEKVLKDVVAKGDTLGAGVEKECEQAVRSELATSEVKGRVGEVRVDANAGHVVTYVEWRNDDGTKLEEEAATVALLASRSAPITSTVAVWAKDAAGRKVFEAKISADSASHFSQEHIPMFARPRYIRVFEDVHNLYAGTPPTD